MLEGGGGGLPRRDALTAHTFPVRFHAVGKFNYILHSDIEAVLGREAFAEFMKWMRGCTVPLVDEGPAVYSWDLTRWLSGWKVID